MIYDPPKDYYSLVVGGKCIEVYPFSLDSESERMRAYQAARDRLDLCKGKAVSRNGSKKLRILRWANGNLFQVFPDAKPANIRLVGTDFADSYGPN